MRPDRSAVVKYRTKVAFKGAAAALLGAMPYRRLRDRPSVTLLITSSNNRYPLELTIRTLRRTTRYPNYSIVVADNGSTDGSLELLEQLSERLPLTVIRDAGRAQSRWYDHAFRTFDSDYWLGLHEDLIFLGRDWLVDMLARMERDRSLYLLAGEQVRTGGRFHEPVSGRLVVAGLSLSTWLFCVRTSLRDRLDSSFAFRVEEPDGEGIPTVYDQGGKLLLDMAERGLAYGYMPEWFRLKWHHIGNLSWIREYGGETAYAALKEYQRRDAERRAKRMRAVDDRTECRTRHAALGS
jgi:hypothetical protein